MDKGLSVRHKPPFSILRRSSDSIFEVLRAAKFYEKHHDVVPKLVGTPHHLRQIMVTLKTRAQSLVPQIEQGLTIRDVNMPTSDCSSIQLRIYTPESSSDLFPGIY